MTEQLSGEEMLVKADAAALKQVRQLFSPIVRAVAEEYSVQIEFAP
jgi:hypothetical protein